MQLHFMVNSITVPRVEVVQSETERHIAVASAEFSIQGTMPRITRSFTISRRFGSNPEKGTTLIPASSGVLEKSPPRRTRSVGTGRNP